MDPHAGPTGYYKFDECGDVVNPTIGLTRGVTYEFDQKDGSNWYHALGFAYFPDGAHDDVDELEPGISQTMHSCADDNSCQAPMYYKDGAFAGVGYDGVAGVGGEDFGLDNYEPEFFWPKGDWAAVHYTVKLTITDDNYADDLFYFCHIHAGMSGRIKVMDADGSFAADRDVPALPADYYKAPSAYDAMCGTYGIGDYEESDGACTDTFVCGGDLARGSFGDCLRSMDCAMDAHMRTTLHADPVATFMHQMIPHHNNAINMAKLLLKEDALDAANDEEGEIDDMLWAIVAVQGHQVLTMRSWLDGAGYAASAMCSAAEGRKLAAAKPRLRKEAGRARRLDGHRSGTGAGTSEDPCMTTTGTFTAIVDPHAGPSGYYKFEECGDVVMPVIAMEQNVEYTFVQADPSNWYHPLGFAYFEDGAHNDVDELEPGISQSGSACADDNTCQAPMYYKDGVFAGAGYYGTANGARSAGSCYDITTHVVTCNVAEAECPEYWYAPGYLSSYNGCCHCDASCDHSKETGDCAYSYDAHPDHGPGGEDFGLDAYEPEFFLPKGDWAATAYDVKLTITDTDYTGDLFYFCHIHAGMSGRVKVVDAAGNKVQAADAPALADGYYKFPSAYDEMCGGYGLEAYQESAGLCAHETFVCADDALPAGSFGDCIKAMDCDMDYNMRTTLSADPVASFMHQMIPHHRNAVNMAKLLMKEAALSEANDEEGAVDDMLWDIVSVQAHQIQVMEAWLEANGHATAARCDLQAQDTDHGDEHEGDHGDEHEGDHDGHDHGEDEPDIVADESDAAATAGVAALAAAVAGVAMLA